MVIDVGNTNIRHLFNQNQEVAFKVLNTKENDFKSFLQNFLKDVEIKHIKVFLIYVSDLFEELIYCLNRQLKLDLKSI